MGDIVALFYSTTSTAQTLYANPYCNDSCMVRAKHAPPPKVSYTADPKIQTVLRVVEEKRNY